MFNIFNGYMNPETTATFGMTINNQTIKIENNNNIFYNKVANNQLTFECEPWKHT